MIKVSFLKRQILMLVNQLFVIAFLAYCCLSGASMTNADIFPMVLITLVICDSVYIECMNLKNNPILTKFTLLLTLIAWYLIFELCDQPILSFVTRILGIVILYATVKFVIAFFFQQSAYKFKKTTDIILAVSCVLTISMKFFDEKLFALMLLLQLIISFAVIVFLTAVHRKRALFVVKSEWKRFLISALIVIAVFITYVLLFAHNEEYIGGIGIYLILFLPLTSIHTVAFNNGKGQYFKSLLEHRDAFIMAACTALLLTAAVTIIKLSIAEIFIIISIVIELILLYFTLLYNRAKKENPAQSAPFYAEAVKEIEKEENLKKDFSNYLHDDVLQDLLSVKNMMSKSDKPEIRKIVTDTLDNLNVSIREQMQEYHPVILNSLTMKENFLNLIKSVGNTYPSQKPGVIFECSDKFYLVEPYNYIVYRVMKELVTNAYKHSQAKHLKISLTEKSDEIILCVEDDGVGLQQNTAESLMHKGLSTVSEQIFSLNGDIKNEAVDPSGLKVTVRIPMKGEKSYAYFIGR